MVRKTERNKGLVVVVVVVVVVVAVVVVVVVVWAYQDVCLLLRKNKV